MKMDPNITDNITPEANYLICAATEIFIKQLARNVYEMDKRCLTYQNLAKYVQRDESLDFLHAVVPNKITIREYKKILTEEEQKANNVDSGSDVSSSETSSDDEQSSGSEEEEEEK